MATKNLVPRATGEGGLGTTEKRWGGIFCGALNGLTISPTGAATSAAPGAVALATEAEATAGEDTSKAVTPAGLAAGIATAMGEVPAAAFEEDANGDIQPVA